MRDCPQAQLDAVDALGTSQQLAGNHAVPAVRADALHRRSDPGGSGDVPGCRRRPLRTGRSPANVCSVLQSWDPQALDIPNGPTCQSTWRIR